MKNQKEILSNELSRVETEMKSHEKGSKIWGQLRAVSQTLSWILNPKRFVEPYDSVLS
jgi:hypothetical protein